MAKTKQALLKFLVRKEVFFAKELLRRRVEVVASTQRRTVGWRYFVFKDFLKRNSVLPYVLMDNRFSSEKEDCTEPLNGRLPRQSDSTYRGFLLIWQRAISVASNDILNYSIRDFVLQQVFEILPTPFYKQLFFTESACDTYEIDHDIDRERRKYCQLPTP